MAEHIKKKRGKPKPKSVKSKALDKNSKRRLAVMGKVRKKKHAGVAIQFITRARAIRKLQVSIKDFRRLCILKGIYPREPPNKNFSRTCYHVKDIAYLAHEPLLEKFREFKAYMKKVHRLLNRKDHASASRSYEQRPRYTLEHLIRERYPRFQDSLADLDDALCLLHLFAVMPSIRSIRSAESGENCLRLCREWQLYVVKSKSLRKSFVSVKGIYYQAEVAGEKITWIVPHNFAQEVPRDVDYHIMATFLEFYQSLMGFVLYKLYHGEGLRYPPNLNQSLDERGAHLACIQPERMEAAVTDDGGAGDVPEPAPKHRLKDDEGSQDEIEQQRQSEERIQSLSSKMREIVKGDQAESTLDAIEEDAADPHGETEASEAVVFADDEEAKKLEENEKKLNQITNLLSGCTFYLSREVPFQSLEFVIRSFGGDVLSAACDDSPDDHRITHFVTDRPNVAKSGGECEYVQPQWVYDSTNFHLHLPVARYAPDAALPPHLSPFVDNQAAGYKPDYAKEIETLQAAVGVQDLDDIEQPKLLRDIARVEADSDEESGEDDESEVDEERFVDEMKEELGSRRRRAIHAEEDASDEEAGGEAKASSGDEEGESRDTFLPSTSFAGPKPGMVFRSGPQGLGYYVDSNATRTVTFKLKNVVSNRSRRLREREEEHNRRTMMMSRKAKKLYGKMQHGIKEKQKEAAELKRKRNEINAKSKKQRKM